MRGRRSTGSIVEGNKGYKERACGHVVIIVLRYSGVCLSVDFLDCSLSKV